MNTELLSYLRSSKKKLATHIPIKNHSNHSPPSLPLQLFELKGGGGGGGKHNNFTQLDISTQDLPLWLVDNEFSSKYCCVGLIGMTNIVLLNTATNSDRTGTLLSFLVLTDPQKNSKQ